MAAAEPVASVDLRTTSHDRAFYEASFVQSLDRRSSHIWAG
jgi:hypothetical protein